MYFEVNRFVSKLTYISFRVFMNTILKDVKGTVFLLPPKKKFRNNHSYPMAKPSFVPHLQGSNKKCGWAKTSRFLEPNKG